MKLATLFGSIFNRGAQRPAPRPAGGRAQVFYDGDGPIIETTLHAGGATHKTYSGCSLVCSETSLSRQGPSDSFPGPT